jgi:hypothetical protein
VREAEEYPLLEAVARKRWKSLADTVVICED